MGQRFLVVDGNERKIREQHQGVAGETMGQRYARTLISIEPEAACEIYLGADADAAAPGMRLGQYDAAFLTGSHLSLATPTPAVRRQVEFAGELLAAGVPVFGSCWGMQVGVTAAGGRIAADLGEEVALARNIVPTPDGRRHPLLAGRAAAFDALTLHFDRVEALPPEAVVLARNEAAIQAVAFGPGQRCWGVQYHPELTLKHVLANMERQVPDLVARRFCRTRQDARRSIEEFRTLDRNPSRQVLAWYHGVQPEVLDGQVRVTELRNFIRHLGHGSDVSLL